MPKRKKSKTDFLKFDTIVQMKKPKIHVFDSFKAGEDFSLKEKLGLSHGELIGHCYKISMASWELHQGSLPKNPLKGNLKISMRDLKNEL